VAAPRNRLQGGFSSAKRCQAPGALAGDQCLEARVQYGCFLTQPTQLLRLPQQFVVDNDGRSHMHEYCISMHMGQLQPDKADAGPLGPALKAPSKIAPGNFVAPPTHSSSESLVP